MENIRVSFLKMLTMLGDWKYGSSLEQLKFWVLFLDRSVEPSYNW